MTENCEGAGTGPQRSAVRSVPELPPGVVPARVRSFVRRGRFSALTRDRLERLGPAWSLPEGPFEPEVTFGRVAPVVLEIGCGHGAAAIAYAAEFPSRDMLAMDVHSPGLARMLADAADAGLPNLRIETGDVVEFLESRVAPGTFDAAHLFFPDPWPKRKHAKRRFVNPVNLDLLVSVLRPDGHVLVATDQNFYADHVRAEVATHPRWAAYDIERPTWRPTAGFEAKGRAAGRRISELRLDLLADPQPRQD
ncbi:MAG: tRNA (guanine(46)-N(7))-methyltransferase TrmB [Micrococcales bacterium]|nr:tRNA (guanine(46)-N(7))-methyltransferase TrmB [Micrococcales bacterium]